MSKQSNSKDFRGYRATVTIEPGEAPDCEISTTYLGETYSASINRLRNIDGCVENGRGHILEVKPSIIEALSFWAETEGA